MKYTFVDGSGNKYTIQEKTLAFEPMTPEKSSSGIYSGGEAYTMELEKSNLIRIVDLFERAFWSESDQTDTRTMGSGTLTKTVGDETKQIYLSFKSNMLNEILNYLGDLKLR